MKIGLGGIAKGYIVDRMSAVLEKEGFHRYLINAGDLYAKGKWTIFLKNPDKKNPQPICSFTVTNKAISTSGLYERGKHIIDPKTKKSTTHMGSTTAIADESIWADAVATAAFVLGSRKEEKKIKNIPHAHFILVHHHPSRASCTVVQ